MQKQTIYIRNLMYLFDYVYKKGVVDASKVNDKVFCDEFIRLMKQPNMYGTLLDDYTVSWREWRDILSQWSGYADAKHTAPILRNIRSYSGYLACILPIAMDFYMKGIADYNNAPIKGYIPIFKESRLEEWIGQFNKPMKMIDYAGQAQIFSYERVRIEKGIGLPEVTFQAYRNWLWEMKLERSTYTPKRIKI